MNIQEIIHKIRSLMPGSQSVESDPLIQLLIHSLQHTGGEEHHNCDEFFADIDQYAEMNIHGQDAAKLMPLIKEHLEICNGCEEEYEALLRILEEKSTA